MGRSRRDHTRDRRSPERRRHRRDDHDRRDRDRRSPERRRRDDRSRRRSSSSERDRDRRHRDRDHRRRRRSPSEERRRDQRDSRRRPRERDDRSRQQRQFRYDSPPREEDKQRTILAAAAQLGATASCLLEAQNLVQSESTAPQASRLDRKLFVGQLPPSPKQTSQSLVDLMNGEIVAASKKAGWSIEPGLPVVSAWVSLDGTYGFIELRSAEQAELVFNLSLNAGGNQLKLGSVIALTSDNQNEENATIGVRNPLLGGQKTADEQILPLLFGPSRILQLRDIANFENTARFDKCCELYSDILAFCEQFGPVEQVVIPRPIWVDGMQETNEKIDKEERERQENENFLLGAKKRRKRIVLPSDGEPIDDARNFRLPDGFGSAFVAFTDQESANEAKQELTSVLFDGRKIEVAYWNEEMFKKGQFSDLKLVRKDMRPPGYEGVENLAIKFQ